MIWKQDMKKKKSPLLKITKETPEARKKRVSSGIKFRAAVFENRKKQLQEKLIDYEENV
jgi:hypothetical protein